MGHCGARARRGDLLAERRGRGASHDGHGGPAEPRHVARHRGTRELRTSGDTVKGKGEGGEVRRGGDGGEGEVVMRL